jgi:hypothetical protein
MDSRVAYWIATGEWRTIQEIVELDKHTDGDGQIYITDAVQYHNWREVHDPTGTWTPQQKAAQYDQLVREYEDGV